MNIVKNLVVVILFAIFSTSVMAAEIFKLPSTQQVHNLAIESTDDVIIEIQGSVWLNGYVKTDGSLTFTGAGTYHLNTGFVVSGIETDGPERINFFGTGDTHINTPLFAYKGIQTWRGFGSKAFVHADLATEGHLSITGPSGGTTFGSGLTITAETFYSDSYESAFFLGSDSSITTTDSIGIRSSVGITLQGSLTAGNGLLVNGIGGNAPLNIQRPITMIEGTGGFVRGSTVNVNAPIQLSGNSDLRGNLINIYGKSVTSTDVLNINAATTNAYGGYIAADTVCIEGQFNNYGALVESSMVCE